MVAITLQNTSAVVTRITLWEILLNVQECPVRLPVQSMTRSQRCFRQSLMDIFQEEDVDTSMYMYMWTWYGS